MVTIPSPVPSNYRVNFAYPTGQAVSSFRLYSQVAGGAAIVVGAVGASARQFALSANHALGVQVLFVRAVAASGTESDNSNAVEVDVTDKPQAPTDVVVVAI